MKLVKLCAWEKCFGQLIENARAKELQSLWNAGLFEAGQGLFWDGLPILVTCSTFALFVLLGNELTPAIAFTSLALFNILEFPVYCF